MDRVNPNFSVGVNIGEQRLLVDRVYDHVHLFPWLGHGILKILTDEGLMQIHVGQEDALKVAEGAGIKPLVRDEISQSEYDKYLEAQETQLERWLED